MGGELDPIRVLLMEDIAIRRTYLHGCCATTDIA
jgi:hypothetical protein